MSGKSYKSHILLLCVFYDVYLECTSVHSILLNRFNFLNLKYLEKHVSELRFVWSLSMVVIKFFKLVVPRTLQKFVKFFLSIRFCSNETSKSKTSQSFRAWLHFQYSGCVFVILHVMWFCHDLKEYHHPLAASCALVSTAQFDERWTYGSQASVSCQF